MAAGAGLLAGGAVAGAVVASTMTAGAATPSPSPVTGSSVQEGPGMMGHGFALDLTGTVKAVGSDTVTITTSAGATKVYRVTSTSDIDKNGEAQLSSLAVGDAVRYSVVTGTTTIDKLHAGDEAKDMPVGNPGDGALPGSGAGA